MSSLGIMHSGNSRAWRTARCPHWSRGRKVPALFLELTFVSFSLLELKKITLLSGEEEKLLLIANPHRADEFIVGKFRKG